MSFILVSLLFQHDRLYSIYFVFALLCLAAEKLLKAQMLPLQDFALSASWSDKAG
jgi:hypothetical protein